jgi:hypothetical protein
MINMEVTILFARSDSIYKQLPNCDVWDAERDATLYDGDNPIVAHPPCRAWGHLKGMAKPVPGERNFARLSVALVRKNGGVLEHPKASGLWIDQGLPEGKEMDFNGGFTLHVDQWWWGHKAKKATKLYICGCSPRDLPEMPYRIGDADFVVGTSRGKRDMPEITKREREATPVEFAKWLITVARICAKNR